MRRRLLSLLTLLAATADAGVASGQAAGFDVLRIDHPDQLAEKLRTLLNGLKIG